MRLTLRRATVAVQTNVTDHNLMPSSFKSGRIMVRKAPKVVVWVGTIATRRVMLSEGKRQDQLRLKRAKIVLNTAPLPPVAQYTCESVG